MSQPDLSTAFIAGDQASRMRDDEFARLERRVREYRPLNPYVQLGLYSSIIIGGSSSVIRGYYGWSYEEAGILINLGFWGGYLLAVFVFTPLMIRSWYKDWRLIKDVEKLKEQKTLREMP